MGRRRQVSKSGCPCWRSHSWGGCRGGRRCRRCQTDLCDTSVCGGVGFGKLSASSSYHSRRGKKPTSWGGFDDIRYSSACWWWNVGDEPVIADDMLSALWRRSCLCGLCWWTRWGMAGVTWSLQLIRMRMNVLMVMLTSRICCEEWTDGLWRQDNEENLESSSTCTYLQPSPQASHKSADLKVEHYDDATLPYKTYARKLEWKWHNISTQNDLTRVEHCARWTSVLFDYPTTLKCF